MIRPTRLFLHYLGRLREMLERVDAFDRELAGKRLHPDMAPLVQQSRTAIGFSLRTTCPLAGREIVSFRTEETSLRSVLAELDASKRYLAEIPDDAFDGIDALRVETVAGFAELEMPAWDYYLMYAVPNFFFHYTTVYAIARQAGVPLGKGDFDGYHSYPPGFSFAPANAA